MRRLTLVSLLILAFSAHAESTLPPPVTSTSVFRPASTPKRQITEQVMPGLGKMPGDKEALKANVVRVSSDRNEIVYISRQFLNRIATPFADPKSVDNVTAELKASGQSLYVSAKDDKPVAIFITGANASDPVVSLTLVPKDLPSQTIVLQMDTPLASTGGDPADAAPDDADYAERIRFLLRAVALGKTPPGFVEGALPKAVARMGSLIAVPEARFSGSSYDIYKYGVENASADVIELDESAFYTDSVRAIAFFPIATLQKGQSTNVFVISDKSVKGD